MTAVTAIETPDATQVKPSGPHRWKKGQSGNPKGLQKGEARTLLDEAIAAVGIVKKKTLFRHAVEQAYVDNKVLVAILKKVVPDLRHIEGNINASIEFMTMLVAGRKEGKWSKPIDADVRDSN